MTINEFAHTPINFSYLKPQASQIDLLKTQQGLHLLEESYQLILGNDYYKKNYPGTHVLMWTREGVFLRLQEILKFLSPHYSIYLFDAFRTKTTQAFIFQQMEEEIKGKHPEFSQTQLAFETRKYVTHPDEPERFAVLPHNSGGAIDLLLVDAITKKPLAFGSPIDETDNISGTDFFEDDFDPTFGMSEDAWLNVRRNRRILFHTMTHFGFTNYPSEWWHYDLGNCMWSQALGVEWIFDSLEPQVKAFINKEGSSGN